MYVNMYLYYVYVLWFIMYVKYMDRNNKFQCSYMYMIDKMGDFGC